MEGGILMQLVGTLFASVCRPFSCTLNGTSLLRLGAESGIGAGFHLPKSRNPNRFHLRALGFHWACAAFNCTEARQELKCANRAMSR